LHSGVTSKWGNPWAT